MEYLIEGAELFDYIYFADNKRFIYIDQINFTKWQKKLFVTNTIPTKLVLA